MITAVINDQTVSIEIIEPDGRRAVALEKAEFDLISTIDTQLRKHPAFANAYPDARLTRVDSNRVVGDTEEGRFYFRYEYSSGTAEFWGHVADKSTLDFERGIVTVAGERNSG